MSEESDQGGDGSGPSQSCFAACDSGNHPPFLGPTRNSRAEAQNDADLHNATCDVQGALVVCS
jgi:hypothetical protein